MENLQELTCQAFFAHLNGEYEKAVNQYTTVLTSQQSFDLIISKALALIQINKIDDALKECENAIYINRKRSEGYFRRGICKFQQGNVKSAMIDFEEAQDKTTNNPVLLKHIQAYLSKCKAELEQTQLPQKDKSAIEAVPESQQPTQQNQKEAEQKIVQKPIQQKQIIYTWYQNTTTVVIEINFTLFNKNLLKYKFGANKIEIGFPINEERDYNLELDLFHDIVPDQSQAIVHLHKIEIIMPKKEADYGWRRLDTDESQSAKDVPVQKMIVNSSKGLKEIEIKQRIDDGGSNKQVKKNWDVLEKEVDSEMKKHPDQYGSYDPCHKMFQMLYEGGDEDSRRAMIKSYQTSGGTSFSNNWTDAKDKDYEGADRPEAPKGQEYYKQN